MRIALVAISTAVLMATGLLMTTRSLAAEVSDADHLVDVMNRRLESQVTGSEVPWMNPSTGNGGVVIILNTEQSYPEAEPCRSYRYTIEDRENPTVVVEGRACRLGDRLWQRTEAAVSLTPDPGPAPSASPLARADPEPAEPPPDFPPPARKPDPNVFYASIPTPSVY